MLDSAPAYRHQARISVDPALHSVQRALIDETVNRTLDAGRASRLQRATSTCWCAIADRPVAGVRAGWSQSLARRTPKGVAHLIVDELHRPEMV